METVKPKRINSKKKGNFWENRWANWLISKGIKAWKDGASGGSDREKADVGNNLNINFEVKAVKALNLKKAWKQSCLASEKTHNTPYVVVHFDGMKEDEFLVVMNNHDWAEIFLSEEKVAPVFAQQDDRDKRYTFEQTKYWINKAIKHLEN